ncbi:MAG: phosphoribosylformylglycinamidine synthase [Bacteroidales bacterium]|nr:phosphoribosylformylglycinamidine synthase [Bacteroidales bacterium]
MIFFYIHQNNCVIAVDSLVTLDQEEAYKLKWLLGSDKIIRITSENIVGNFLGPHKNMISPWCSNVLSILESIGIKQVRRIEMFRPYDDSFDPMLEERYDVLDQYIFSVEQKSNEYFEYVEDIVSFNDKHGLALTDDDIQYLKRVSSKIERPLTDAEVFGYAQINSEHCRHKIFNGKFIIDGKEKLFTLFELIKKTVKVNPNLVESAYVDNVAFIKGPEIKIFRPLKGDYPSPYVVENQKIILSLKAETHNFPTTVEPFYGASTGTGGEIRDRMAGGQGSIPLAGTAVYMTSLPSWHKRKKFRFPYHLPESILIKASNGASDFANKFGQPLIAGSLYVFDHEENGERIAYDKVIMLAGGVGYALKVKSKKRIPEAGEKVILLGGDNYRIGIGGGSVSSVETGKYHSSIELSAVQRANPEIQKRVFNVIRAIAEDEHNKSITSIHDHGAGGHLNCFVELLEQKGGIIHVDKLPKGDVTLTDVELLVNESQERMGLIIEEKSIDLCQTIARRERAPFYIVGEVNNTHKITFLHDDGSKPFDLKIKYLLENPPKTVIFDQKTEKNFAEPFFVVDNISEYLEKVIQHEAVACKDWLTNKVDRSVTGKVAVQPTCGPLQLPLNNVGVVALDYESYTGIATAIGHASVAGLIDASAGSRLSVMEALTNIVWAPLKHGLEGISLSANWAWPARQKGEDARLYEAVEALSNFCIELGINVPTGKDSLSMTQKYSDGTIVKAPGTVIVTAMAEVSDIRKTITPVLLPFEDSNLIYVDFSLSPFELGGSVFYQTLNSIGKKCPDVLNSAYVKRVFESIQELILYEKILAGHDVSAGGLITALMEMCFSQNEMGLLVNFSDFDESNLVKILFSEKPAIVIQVTEPKKVINFLMAKRVKFHVLGHVIPQYQLKIVHHEETYLFDLEAWRKKWLYPSYRLDQKQTQTQLAMSRFEMIGKQELKYHFPVNFTGEKPNLTFITRKPRVAVIREEGTNGDREMAYSIYAAGMEVIDVHMTDLIEGREDLKNVQMIVFPGGFSYADVLGSATGWSAGFLFNPRAKESLTRFYERKDTLSLGVCNGCQLMVKLGIFEILDQIHVRMEQNDSGKFESAFVLVDIHPSPSIILKPMENSKLGIWIAHGEGKFIFENPREKLHIPMTYAYDQYPGNPNGSMYQAAAICSSDGRHLAMMPHLERSIFPWQWPYYPDKIGHNITPWFLAFEAARKWLSQT